MGSAFSSPVATEDVQIASGSHLTDIVGQYGSNSNKIGASQSLPLTSQSAFPSSKLNPLALPFIPSKPYPSAHLVIDLTQDDEEIDDKSKKNEPLSVIEAVNGLNLCPSDEELTVNSYFTTSSDFQVVLPQNRNKKPSPYHPRHQSKQAKMPYKKLHQFSFKTLIGHSSQEIFEHASTCSD